MTQLPAGVQPRNSISAPLGGPCRAQHEDGADPSRSGARMFTSATPSTGRPAVTHSADLEEARAIRDTPTSLVLIAGSWSSPPLLAQALISIVEDRRAALDTGEIILLRGADAVDQERDAGGFATTELAVLEVDVVHHLGDGA
jgi:hypothetical protein